MSKIDRTVVRNQPYQKSGIGIRERHNERKNESYSNPDIEPQRSHMNVHFQKCAGTYTEALDRMIADGTVSTRGLKADAKVFGELVFDVNTAYFDYHGGYEYAKEFFEYAYHFAEEEVGSQYILSAVMHADEKNRALSKQLGRNVYHYHLHVIYIPVVEKEVRWTKKCKDKDLVGKVKEVIPQIIYAAAPTGRRASCTSSSPRFLRIIKRCGSSLRCALIRNRQCMSASRKRSSECLGRRINEQG